MSDQSTARPAPITAYKGFDKDLKCREYQYEVGKTYTHTGKVEACASGFHACEDPMDVWGYYAPFDGVRFALVECSGAIKRHSDDSKIACGTIKIVREITLGELIEATGKYTLAKAKSIGATGTVAEGSSSKAASSGEYSKAASSGNSSTAASSGNYSTAASSGEYSTAASSGDYS